MSRAPYIRTMRDTETALWAALRSRLWPDCGPEDNAEDIAAYRAGGPVKVVFLAFDGDDAPIGFAEISERSVVDSCGLDPAPYLEGWYVDPDWRGQGIGSALIDSLIDIARQHGIDAVQIGAAISNPRALELYRRLGFQDWRRQMMDVGQGLELVIFLRKEVAGPS